MSVINVNVIDQSLKITNTPLIASNGVKEDYIKFTFDSVWNGFSKVAVFYHAHTPETIYRSIVDAEGKALVPWEVTSKDGKIYFGVCGIKNDIVYTSEMLFYEVVKGAVNAGTESTPITPGIYEQILTMVESLKSMVGSPLVASTTAGMTDRNKIYVYTGSETGYTAGNWYYYNGSAWTSGGVYNSVAFNTDTTLSISGKAADAKKVGDEFAILAADTAYLNGIIEFESGAFAGDRKTKTDNVKRIRNTRPIPIDQYLRLTLPTGYLAYFWLFDKDMNYLGNTQNVSSLPILNSGYPALKYVNIQITKTGAENDDISAYISDVESNFTTTIRTKTDTALLTSDLPADAKIVGNLFAKTRKVNYINVDYNAGISANDLKTNGVYYSSITTEYPDGQILDLPSPYYSGWLEVTRALATGNVVLQIFYPYDVTAHKPQMRTCSPNGSWTAWTEIGSGAGSNIINNIIQNTYNVTATPTLTSGLPYVLQSTGDTTDRTADIATVLTQYGSCYLGTGAFYVKNLTMPDGTSILGSGIGRTTLRLIDDSENECYAVGVRNRCSVSDLRIDGGLNARPESAGLRHGLSYQGTYIDSENPGTYPARGQINNLDIKGFTGSGIICSNTSGSTSSGMNVVNVNIYACYNGIEIKNVSEYHKFTNVSVTGCAYGVINNCGNNMFVNCGINSNITGFVIDNRDGLIYNDSHGSVVGCTFNHSGGNSGTAIKLVGVTNGYVFNGCQIFYGKIDIKNSVAVQFSNCNFGRQTPIDINGGGIVLFDGNIFYGTPTVTKTNSPIVQTANCYSYNGTALTI